MTSFTDERGAELRDLFFESSQELLQTINDEALKLEKTPEDSEAVRSIRRAVHTLKGDAAACGFRELSELAHELEDALAIEIAPTHASLAEVAFAAADIFAAMLVSYRKKTKLPSCEPLRKMIRTLAGAPESEKPRRKKASSGPRVQAAWTEYEKLSIQHAQAAGKKVFHIVAMIDPNCTMPIAARQLVLNGLSGLGEVLATKPEAGSAESTKRLEFAFATDNTAEQVLAKCRIPTVIADVTALLIKSAGKKAPAVEAADIEKHDAEVPPASAVAEDEPETPLHAPSATTENVLRVDAERIDNVLNLVGELIIGKSMLQQALHELVKHNPRDAMRGRFSDAMAFQARVLNDLQRSVMKIRMVPVEQLFRRFPRMVRDVSKHCGKNVELVVIGQDTDLDKSILDAIAEPLTHLVRNAIWHGIEPDEDRCRTGKPAQGTLKLAAYHQGNQVVIEVSDDGRGVDLERIKAKAMEKGLLGAEEAARLSEAEILDFVFRPGFSTADEVTEIAGRGVGLDVVQSVLHRLKGSVNIETRPGQGTVFRLKLPLTLAIIKAILFRVEQRLYAIPLNSVAEISRAHESDLHQVDNYEVLQMRSQVLPLVRLGRRTNEQSTAGKIFVLVIQVGERKLGLIVDALEGEEELVIKALDDQTVATDLVSGASILGDGRVVLILNIAAVVERFSKTRLNRHLGSLGLLSAGQIESHDGMVGQ